MSTQPNVKALFDLPSTVHKIGFVEELARAVSHPKATAESYVVTPAIVGAFDKALELVSGALRDGRSRAAFLQGSFGSGKSHFMALVSLLLDGEENAWRIPELHALREKYGFAGKSKLLQLRFHMIGHTGNLEGAIFLRYLDAIRERHPGADLPGVFADEKLFADAKRVLDELGDEKFFAPMNAGKKNADGWGAIGADALWTRERFDAAAKSPDTKEREDLFNALAKTRFGAFAQESHQFVGLDEGLATLARHAKGLGYEGIVLFLDELILWLASRAADVTWFHNEVQKLVKLVESQDAKRDVPLVSFIARQRDLVDMVGKDYEGLANALVRDSLKWSEGRFDTIRLDDRNLPAIAEKRILKVKDEAARTSLDQAFRTMRSKLGDAGWQLLLGELDEKEFRRLYPFSPALMDALVSLSNSLQRERTAIRLLTEMMVEHIEDLSVGDLVGVGDLFDVVSGGDDATDGVMRSRFDSAKQLYNFQFLPVIQKANGTDNPARCQRLRPEHPARIGCSNCTEKSCRTDNRLIKTLLVAALVPERPAFKDLTASRLVQLNHGSLRAPVPGTEASLVAQKLRNWASSGTIAQLHVGQQSDPTVRVQLEGVDTAPILEQARQYDTAGARQRVLRDMLFAALGLETVTDWGVDHVIEWRGTRRPGYVRFGNVRKLPAEQLVCNEDQDWRIVIDYPFDDETFGPHDDEAALEEFLKAQPGGTWTLVWLPTFFSKDMQRMLGDLVVLDHILSDQPTTKQYVSHLSVDNQSRAVTDLTNLRTQKESRIRQVLEQAYGLAKPNEGDLDLSNKVESHLVLLKPGAKLRPQLAATLSDAVGRYAEELLGERYRNHPKFPKRLTKNATEELITRFGEIVDAEEKAIPVDKERAELMRSFLVELGLVRVTEDKAFLRDDDILQRLENTRNKKSADRPTIEEVRSWIDDTRTRGLQPDVEDLILRCFARWSARTLMNGEQVFEARAGQPIPSYVALERPDLPTQTVWAAALGKAGEVLGITFAGRALHGDNLKRFEAEVQKRVKETHSPASRLPGLLVRRLSQFNLDESVDRLVTARSADTLVAELAGKRGKDLAAALSAFEPRTSGRAVAASLAGAAAGTLILEDDLVFGPLEQLEGRPDLVGAEELLARAAQALRQDELHVQLASRIRDLAKEAQRLLQPKATVPQAPGTETRTLSARGRGHTEITAALAKLTADAEKLVTDAGDSAEIAATVQITWSKKT
jgi:hypothetical protein